MAPDPGLTLKPGARLVREWHGRTHTVTVSLSAIARVITGTNWNGWAFFGLKRRAKEAPADA